MNRTRLLVVALIVLAVGLACLLYLMTRRDVSVQIGDSFSDACRKMEEAGGERVFVPLDTRMPPVKPRPGEEPKPPVHFDHAVYDFSDGRRIILTGVRGKITVVEEQERPRRRER